MDIDLKDKNNEELDIILGKLIAKYSHGITLHKKIIEENEKVRAAISIIEQELVDRKNKKDK